MKSPLLGWQFHRFQEKWRRREENKKKKVFTVDTPRYVFRVMVRVTVSPTASQAKEAWFVTSILGLKTLNGNLARYRYIYNFSFFRGDGNTAYYNYHSSHYPIPDAPFQVPLSCMMARTCTMPQPPCPCPTNSKGTTKGLCSWLWNFRCSSLISSPESHVLFDPAYVLSCPVSEVQFSCDLHSYILFLDRITSIDHYGEEIPQCIYIFLLLIPPINQAV